MVVRRFFSWAAKAIRFAKKALGPTVADDFQSNLRKALTLVRRSVGFISKQHNSYDGK
jgi:hypothetical protein